MFTTASVKLTVEQKEKILNSMRDYHSDLLSDLNVDRKNFQMKKPFLMKDGSYKIPLFESELKKKEGFYIELIDGNFQPYDPERTVYRIPYNEFCADEYGEVAPGGYYLVPLEELRIINKLSAAISKSNLSKVYEEPHKMEASTPKKNVVAFPTPKITQPKPEPVIPDAPYSEMTIRDYYAIHTGKLVSLKPWLNELIQEHNN